MERRPYHRLEALETRAGRPLTIVTDPDEPNLAKCHSQPQSLLFNLPGEIRNLIFQLVTAPEIDVNNTYPETDQDYRPDIHGKLIVSTGILQTCRRAWLEANHLPMQQMRHCFWPIYQIRGDWRPYVTSLSGSLHRREEQRLVEFSGSLTLNNKKNYTTLHLFAQMFWLEQRLSMRLKLSLSNAGACPETLIITIRHYNWHRRGEGAPLSQIAEQQWLQGLLRWRAPPRLREIRLELESMESRMRELRPIVDRVRQKFKLLKRTNSLGDHVHVRLAVQPDDWTWRGSNFAGAVGRPAFASMETVQYRVVTVVWDVLSAPDDAEDMKREFGLEDDILDPDPALSSGAPALSIPQSDEVRRTVEGSEGEEESARLASMIPAGSLLKLIPRDLSDD